MTTEMAGFSAYSFGDPEPVLSRHITQYSKVFDNGTWYQPPFSLNGMAKCQFANAHHGSCLHFKANMILKWMEPSKLLPREVAQRLAYDLILYGMMYPQYVRNRFMGIIEIDHVKTLYTRRMVKKEQFLYLTSHGQHIKFQQDEVKQVGFYDGIQTEYGVPEYFAGLQAPLLSEDATLFSRKYYKNGAHMGNIFLTTAEMSKTDKEAFERSIKESKGPGNFRSIHLHIPGAKSALGKKDEKKPLEVIPVGEISQGDDYETIKNISRSEILAMHRVHPALAAVMPENNGGFGDLNTISEINYENEVVPLQQLFSQINEMLPSRQHITFREPDWKQSQSA